LAVHIENAATHNARAALNFFEHIPLKRLPQPPYSPNISSADFPLFGKVKSPLIGQEFPDGIRVFEIVTDNSDGISGDGLQAVFRGWIERVQDVMDANEDYLSYQTFWLLLSRFRLAALWPIE
jgi:hypothetical protein